MKANELRIGNLVWDDYSGEMIVCAIWADQLPVCVDLKKAEHLPSGRYGLDSIKPIPITEEWLVKFGFERKKYSDETFIQYVHQLQNLYFALTGKELEISNNLT